MIVIAFRCRYCCRWRTGRRWSLCRRTGPGGDSSCRRCRALLLRYPIAAQANQQARVVHPGERLQAVEAEQRDPVGSRSITALAFEPSSSLVQIPGCRSSSCEPAPRKRMNVIPCGPQTGNGLSPSCVIAFAPEPSRSLRRGRTGRRRSPVGRLRRARVDDALAVGRGVDPVERAAGDRQAPGSRSSSRRSTATPGGRRRSPAARSTGSTPRPTASTSSTRERRRRPTRGSAATSSTSTWRTWTAPAQRQSPTTG